MALSLSDFIKFKKIIIQCHDNPDADALASGFALQLYFKKHGMDVPFVYGGKNKVSKANLCLMMKHLNIQAKHVAAIPKQELLI